MKVASDDVNNRTLSAKIREGALAYHLSHQWSKDKILTEYLNAIYYGNGAYGLESAARTYFADMNGNDCGTPRHPKWRGDTAARPGGAPGRDHQLADGLRPSSIPWPRRSAAISCSRRCAHRGSSTRSSTRTRSPSRSPAPEQIKPPSITLKDEGAGYFVGWIRAQLAERYKETPESPSRAG